MYMFLSFINIIYLVYLNLFDKLLKFIFKIEIWTFVIWLFKINQYFIGYHEINIESPTESDIYNQIKFWLKVIKNLN